MAYFRMIANVVSGAEFNFFGDGSIERDFTFIDDAVNSVVLLTKDLQKNKPGFSDVVNLGDGRPLSMNYLLKTVIKISGKRVKFIQQSEDQNDAKKTLSDPRYIQSLVGNRTHTKLEDGLIKTIEWESQTHVSPQLNRWIQSTK